MPVQINTISYEEARKIVNAIIEHAHRDEGSAIAVAVVDAAGRLKHFAAMDYVMPASIKLAQSKAYSAVIGQRDTLNWASFPKSEKTVDFDMRNWTDDNFSGFTGGVVIKCREEIIGGVGVSGRKGKKETANEVMQDHELAEYGRDILNQTK